MFGFCNCGCGQKTPLAPLTDLRRGWIKNQPLKFINHHNLNRNYFLKRKGFFKSYPMAQNSTGRSGIREHILIAEKALGKPLPPLAVVHHFNPKKSNGTLVICQNQSYHFLLHKRTRALKGSGHVDWEKCFICKQFDDPQNLSRHRHPLCIREYNRALLLKRKGENH